MKNWNGQLFIVIKSVEAKRKGDWNKLTEKITVTKSASGPIEVHSKTIEGNFIDFGKTLKRRGLFIALFQKLATEYQQNGKLKELETELKKKIVGQTMNSIQIT